MKDEDISGNSSFNSEWVRQIDMGRSSDFGDAFHPLSPKKQYLIGDQNLR